MRPLFWLSLALVLYTYVGYPLAIALLARLRPRAWTRKSWPAHAPPPVSIVMAVHNGAAALDRQLDHLLALAPDLVREVVVVSDGSTDQTAALLARRQDSRLSSIRLERQVGKAAALNHGMTAATGEILLFIDLRPRVGEGAVAALLSNFADTTVGCVAGELLLSTAGQEATASAVSGLYWRYEQWIRNCEAAWDSPVGVYGGFYAVRRSLATNYPAGTILDDMFQPLSIIRKGYRSVLDRTALVTDSWPGKTTGEYARKVRTLAGNFQLLAVAPWLLTPSNRVVWQLVSHKLLRLGVPYCFLFLLVSSVLLGRTSAGFAFFAALQIAFWLMALTALRYRMPVLDRIATPASALLVLNAAAVGGLYKFLFTRGPLWKIWTATPLSQQQP